MPHHNHDKNLHVILLIIHTHRSNGTYTNFINLYNIFYSGLHALSYPSLHHKWGKLTSPFEGVILFSELSRQWVSTESRQSSQFFHVLPLSYITRQAMLFCVLQLFLTFYHGPFLFTWAIINHRSTIRWWVYPLNLPSECWFLHHLPSVCWLCLPS